PVSNFSSSPQRSQELAGSLANVRETEGNGDWLRVFEVPVPVSRSRRPSFRTVNGAFEVPVPVSRGRRPSRPPFNGFFAVPVPLSRGLRPSRRTFNACRRKWGQAPRRLGASPHFRRRFSRQFCEAQQGATSGFTQASPTHSRSARSLDPANHREQTSQRF